MEFEYLSIIWKVAIAEIWQPQAATQMAINLTTSTAIGDDKTHHNDNLSSAPENNDASVNLPQHIYIYIYDMKHENIPHVYQSSL